MQKKHLYPIILKLAVKTSKANNSSETNFYQQTLRQS
jgi:hypothetical protein